MAESIGGLAPELVFGIVLGAVAMWLVGRRRSSAAPATPHTGPGVPGESATNAPAAATQAVDCGGESNDSTDFAAIALDGTPLEDLARLEPGLDLAYGQASTATEFRELPAVRRAIERLTAADVDTDLLLTLYTGEKGTYAWVALAALAERSDGVETVDQVLSQLGRFHPWTRWFGLVLAERWRPAPTPLIPTALAMIDDSWDNDANGPILVHFLRRRLEQGEPLPDAAALARLVAAQRTHVDGILARSNVGPIRALRERLAAHFDALVDLDFLAEFGRVRAAAEPQALPLEHPQLARDRELVRGALSGTPPRSVMIVGRAGTGKSSLVRAVGENLVQDGWLVFEAAPEELNADQKFIGELEGRVRRLLRELAKRPGRAVWVVRDAHALAWTGRHQHNRTAALDMILPAIERGELLLLGESEPEAYEQLLLNRPRCAALFAEVRLEPADEATTLDLARRWSAAHAHAPASAAVAPAVLTEGWHLAQQFLAGIAAPGNLIGLLTQAHRAARSARGPAARVELPDLFAALAQETGLPAAILDEREILDLAALRRFFEQRVMGQTEAIEALLERVAMLKAGLSDPGRPVAVLLFVGPTGTGKTELAKALAEFLFGDEQRMLRLDMSELQAPDGAARIVGDPHAEQGEALVDQIRRQPFSVVLLDEFEKSHPTVWDLFLQLFDDGRLTDRRGHTADFRHAIVILTSNLGSVIAAGGPGFRDEQGRFSETNVQRAVAKAFRPEFLNRIDRIVVFRPLSRETMRSVLARQLREAFQRRGLRNRQWAVEWDPGALDFLLERGFTVDLGARPLQRAIERHLLAPLARTIVDHTAPEGDQFLFVRLAGDRLEVEFVDPDAADRPVAGLAAGEAARTAGERPRTLRAIALNPLGDAADLDQLEAAWRTLEATTQTESWREQQALALAQTASEAFWNSPERFELLGRIEYRERFEDVLAAAGSLITRLRGEALGSGRRHAPSQLAAHLAQRLFVLQTAAADLLEHRPRESFLAIEPLGDPGRGPSEAAQRFAARLAAMYRGWAERRGMRCTALGAPHDAMLFGFSGLGSFTLLRGEHGLHLLEHDGAEGPQRCQVRVRLAPQPSAPPRASGVDLAEQARRALEPSRGETPAVVRRYRDGESPLVRDAVHGWRSGRFDRVLEGDFDLFEPELPSA